MEDPVNPPSAKAPLHDDVVLRMELRHKERKEQKEKRQKERMEKLEEEKRVRDAEQRRLKANFDLQGVVVDKPSKPPKKGAKGKSAKTGEQVHQENIPTVQNFDENLQKLRQKRED